MTILHRIDIVVNEHGQPQGATIQWRYDEPGTRTSPIAVGPFDTLDEVLDRCVARLDVQLSLW